MLIVLLILFVYIGRYDIARALEKWGGLHEVARLLTLHVRHPNRQSVMSRRMDHLGTSIDAEERQEEEKSTSCVSQDTHKWISQLEQLDIINWVE